MGRGFRSGGGSSGGGFSGGGFSGGRSSRSSFGGSSRGGFGGHHHHRHTVYIGPRRHYHHYYGGYGYGDSNPFSFLITIMIFFAIFLGIAGLGLRGNINQQQEYVQMAIEDYNYYQDLIENAEEKGYIVEGIVENKYYDMEVEKYYIEYRLKEYGPVFETFSVYTYAEAQALENGGPIQIALDRPVSQMSQAESIDVAFKNVKLEDFSLYVQSTEGMKGLKTASYVCLAISGGLVVGLILIAVRGNKKSSEASQPGTTSGPVSSSSSACKYCGTIHESGTKKCNNCGAQLR